MAEAVLVALIGREGALEGIGSSYNQITRVDITVHMHTVCMYKRYSKKKKKIFSTFSRS